MVMTINTFHLASNQHQTILVLPSSSTQNIFDTYNASPRGQRNPGDARTFPAKITEMMADHAEDQKWLACLINKWKMSSDHEIQGEHTFASLIPDKMV